MLATSTADDKWLWIEHHEEPSVTHEASREALLALHAHARHARPTSVHIVWTCTRYAASVRYHRVTLRDLAAEAGVSERRIRHAFSECFHVSPTAYLRVAALRQVRRTLLEGAPERDAVTRAASDFGFWHLGRFANQYRALFGESPSATLARTRALCRSNRT